MQSIGTWHRFRRTVRASGRPLLVALDRFPDAVLVSGCQRSGTTILSRIIAGTEGMGRFAYTKDDELDAALILSGVIDDLPPARYCFQTTYMYDSHDEYVTRMRDQRLVWVLRNPFSVVYSMLHNWLRPALNELFMGCGVRHLAEPYRYRLQLFGIMGVPPPLRACLSYRSKLEELSWLRERLPASSLLVVDYDELVAAPHELLGGIYDRLGLAYRHEYGAKLLGTSVDKASRLAVGERHLVEQLCQPAYEHARTLVTVRGAA